MMYCMIGTFTLGAGMLLMLELLCRYLQKQTENMGTTNDRLLKQLRLKFESCYKLKNSIHNLDVFIDKYLYRYRFLGLSMAGWSHTTEAMLLAAGVIGVAGIKVSPEAVKEYLIVWMIGSVALLFLSRMQDLPGKQTCIKINIKDYLENTLVNQIAQTDTFSHHKNEVKYTLKNKEQRKDNRQEKYYMNAKEENEMLEQLLKEILA